MPKYKDSIKEYQLIVQAKLSSGDRINERELDFFCRKNIRGLLKAKFVKKFLFTGIEYSGPVGIALSVRMNKPVTKYDFFFIMEQIVDIVQKAKANGLPLNKIVWDPNCVYINETTRELQFIYLPLENAPAEADIIGFIERIIYSAKPDTGQDTDYITEFTYFLKGMRTFDPDKTEKYIIRIDPKIVNIIKKHGQGQSGFMTDKQKDYYEHYKDDDQATGLIGDDEDEATGLLDEDEATGLLVNDEDGTDLLVEEGTSLLDEETVKQVTHYATLYRESTGENIQVNGAVFRLGKDKSSADYCVSNNSAVSRSHADIIGRGSSHYVTDLGSKNGTFINGKAIPKYQEVPIQDGDELKLANEVFVFYS